MRALDENVYASAIARTSERFALAALRPWERHFAREKLLRDPVTRALAELGPMGDVLDIGTGRGQLALLLLELGHARSVRGLDWDEPKVSLGSRAAAVAPPLDASFVVGDVDAIAPDASFDTVLLIDVLHYLSAPQQDALVLRAGACVAPGGRLIIREASLGYGARSTFTRLVETCSRAVRLNLGTHTVLRDLRRDLVPVLDAMAFRTTLRPCWQGTPTANVLLVGERVAGAARSVSDPAA